MDLSLTKRNWDSVMEDSDVEEEEVRSEPDPITYATQELPELESPEAEDLSCQEELEIDEDGYESVEESQDLLEGAVKKGRKFAVSSQAAKTMKSRLGYKGEKPKLKRTVKEREEGLMTTLLGGCRRIDAKKHNKTISEGAAREMKEELLSEHKKKSESLRKQTETTVNSEENKGKKVRVIDMSLDEGKKFSPCKFRLDSTLSVGIATVSLNKGGSKSVTYDTISIERANQKDPSKTYSFQIPLKHLTFVSKALQSIVSSNPAGPQTGETLTLKQIHALKPDKDGYRNLCTAADSGYSRDVFKANNYTIQVDDRSYNTSTGVNTYEALIFTKEYTAKDGTNKTYEMNMTVRHLPAMNSAFAYLAHVRRNN